MATPHNGFGELYKDPQDPETHLLVRYNPADEMDPHGLSGCGIWYSCPSNSIIWAPQIALAGLAIQYDRSGKALVCYRVERLIAFLANENRSITN